MSAVIQAVQPDLKTELTNWRDRLEATAKASPDSFELNGLLLEVSAAIERLTQKESYGICQVCHDLIGQAAMTSDPIARTCLNCLTPEQLSELEDDLDRAWLIQGELLPKQNLKFNGWEVAYHYEPAGPVSGDYCDLISTDAGDLYFMIGDVAGKGVAASLLMTRLHAIFRSLIGTESSVSELVERVNYLFADTTMRPLRDAGVWESERQRRNGNLQCWALPATSFNATRCLCDSGHGLTGGDVLPGKIRGHSCPPKPWRSADSVYRWRF